jgi:hypothetical protein
MKYCSMVLTRSGVYQVILFGRGETNVHGQFIPHFWYYLYYSPTKGWGSPDWEASKKVELINSKKDLQIWNVEPSSLFDELESAQKHFFKELFTPSHT